MTIELQLGASRAQAPQSTAPFQECVIAENVVWTQFFRLGSRYLVRFPSLADFEISGDGQRVLCRPVPGTADGTIQHLFLNHVLPLARSRAGTLMLHASAVAISEASVAFLGASGSGKSTLAASFATSGMHFLTDDGLQLELDTPGGVLQALPSHPSIRLREDSQLALVGRTPFLAPAVEYASKARLLVQAGLSFCEKARPLQALYFLGAGDERGVSIRPLSSRMALMELVRNSFLLGIDERETLARHFDELTAIANRPIHYQLDYPRRYDALPAVRQAILGHCAAE